MTARERKDRAAAKDIATLAREMKPGAKAAVVGNDLPHAERLVALVHETAAALGFDVSHVTFTPIGVDQIIPPSTH